MRQYDSRAWRLVEALDNAPFNVDERVEMVQRFLDEERGEAAEAFRYAAACVEGEPRGYHPPSPVRIVPENAPEGF